MNIILFFHHYQVSGKYDESRYEVLFSAMPTFDYHVVRNINNTVIDKIMLNEIIMMPNVYALRVWFESWKCHQMETFSALLVISARNPPITGEFPTQRPVTRSFAVFFDLRLNERLSKQGEAGDFKRHRSHYDVIVMDVFWSLHWDSINSSPPSVAYIRQSIGSALVQIVACHIFGAKA